LRQKKNFCDTKKIFDSENNFLGHKKNKRRRKRISAAEKNYLHQKKVFCVTKNLFDAENNFLHQIKHNQ